MNQETAVLEAAAKIVAAFGNHEKEKYFSLFDPNCTFLFYNSNKTLSNRAAYEAEWEAWEKDGFKVHSCTSSDGAVTLFGYGKVAVFTHTVRTDLSMGGERFQTGERESIVFEFLNGQWIATHEHLSADPNYES